MRNVIILVIPTITSYLLNINWELFGVFLILMILDIITGCISAMKNGKWKSSDMRKGLYKKFGEIIVLATVIIAQRMIQLNGIDSPPVFEIFVSALGFSEIGSILENQISLGVKIPDFVTKWFKVTENIVTRQNVKDEAIKEVENKNESN
jgi:toxin secretion/phage lysis holin